MSIEDLAWEHTRAEWEQAWSQSRHLETMRGQFLGFFFTAVLGVIAVAGPRLNANSPRSLVIVAALALVLEVLSGALFLAVRRINSVYRWYQRIIIAIRDETLGSPPAAVDLSRFRRPPSPAGVGITRALATTSGVSSNVLGLGVWTFAIVLVGTVIRSITMPHAATAAIVICAAAVTVGLLFGGFCWLGSRQAAADEERGNPADTKGDPGSSLRPG